MIPVLIFMLVVVVFGVTVYVYFLWEQYKLVSKDRNISALDVFKSKLQKKFCQIREFVPNIFKWLHHHARQVMIFVGVTCVHFFIVYILGDTDNILDASRSFWKTLIFFTLIVPNFILPVDGFPWPFIFSSFTYGGVGVFLESRKTSLQVIGIIFIVFFILAGFVFTVVVMFAQAFT